jgi:hypothetical protein
MQINFDLFCNLNEQFHPLYGAKTKSFSACGIGGKKD